LALASAVFQGDKSVVNLLAKQLEHALGQRDLDLANSLIRDLAYRHRSAFEQFMKSVGETLPPEAREELRRL
jgi:hypothetical protein